MTNSQESRSGSKVQPGKGFLSEALALWIQNKKNALFHPDMPILSWDEVSKHHCPDDCWLVVSGLVYNVTSFIQHHPAGSAAILRYAGQDCTLHFHFHSKMAQTYWRSLPLVGRVVLPQPPAHQQPPSSSSSYSPHAHASPTPQTPHAPRIASPHTIRALSAPPHESRLDKPHAEHRDAQQQVPMGFPSGTI